MEEALTGGLSSFLLPPSFNTSFLLSSFSFLDGCFSSFSFFDTSFFCSGSGLAAAGTAGGRGGLPICDPPAGFGGPGCGPPGVPGLTPGFAGPPGLIGP